MTHQLDIIIIGAGLSGLAASVQCALSGHRVTVLEAAKELAEIGAGLQLTPNCTRLLQRWHVYEKVKSPCEPKTCTVYNYRGKVLAHEDHFDRNMRAKYDAPFSDVKRVDLQRALVDRARDLGVTIHLASKVTSIDTSKSTSDKSACITTESGESYEGDLVIGADGLWSTCLSSLATSPSPPLPTGDLAYRIVLPVHQIPLSKPHLRNIIANPGLRFWVGPNAHVVAYSMRGGTVYNVVLLVPDDLAPGVSRTLGSVDEMRALFEGWDTLLTELLEHVDSVDKWKLMHREELQSWVNERGNLVLIGDSCHPMLPYLAQGANSSIEDGAVLGLLLSKKYFNGKDQLSDTLQLFQQLRKKRGEAIVRETFKQRRDFHLRDGAEQEERDRVFEKVLETGVIEGAFPSRWTCPEVQPWLYGYDAHEEVERAGGGQQSGGSL